ncbi:unnamed protein product [Sympodiomycopsis kandeliae]
MKFFATALVAVLAFAMLVAADVATIKSDVAKIDQQATALSQSLQKEDGSNYFSALAINGAAGDLDNAIKQGVKDVNANTDTVSDADAKDIISTLTGTSTTVDSISARLIAIEPNLEKIGVQGIAKGTLTQTAADTKDFGAALVKQAPAAEKDSASALADKINASLAKAVAAYQ